MDWVGFWRVKKQVNVVEFTFYVYFSSNNFGNMNYKKER